MGLALNVGGDVAADVRADFPLGGAKKSGIGSELGADALDHYTRPHVLHMLAAPGQSRPDYD